MLEATKQSGSTFRLGNSNMLTKVDLLEFCKMTFTCLMNSDEMLDDVC